MLAKKFVLLAVLSLGCELGNAAIVEIPVISTSLPTPFGCCSTGIVDIPQFDPSLGGLNSVSFEIFFTQIVIASIVDGDAPPLSTLDFSATGNVQVPELSISQTKTLTETHTSNGRCGCESEFTLNYEILLNFIDPAFEGSSTLPLTMVSQLLGPTRFGEPSDGIFIDEVLVETDVQIAVSYDYTPVPEPSTRWVLCGILGIVGLAGLRTRTAPPKGR